MRASFELLGRRGVLERGRALGKTRLPVTLHDVKNEATQLPLNQL